MRRDQPVQRLAEVIGELRDVQAGRLAAVGAHDARTAAVCDDGHPAASRKRLGADQRGGVKQLTERLGTKDTGLAEECVDGYVRCRQQRGRV